MKFLLAAILFTGPLALAAEPQNEVKAPDATYVGNQTETGLQFLGIPYAKPPVGDLRWAAPEAIGPQERVVAQKFGSACLQPKDPSNFAPKPGDELTGSEDCLYLNVYAPLAAKTNRPVMVWIHGGGFVTGAASLYDAHLLAERNDLIVVTINYRLGALGFLSLPELGEASGNFGILDQQAALQWVQRNIAAFGGDPKNVTIFGESAGGLSVCTQLLSPSSKGLYARGIIESGLCGPKAISNARSAADQAGAQMKSDLKCSDLACLRKTDANTITNSPSHIVSLGMVAWGPVYGTSVIPKDASAFQSGDFVRVPVIQGTNHDEGRLFAAMMGQKSEFTVDNYKNTVNQLYGANANKILAEYDAAKFPTPALAYAQVVTDGSFACPALAGNNAMAAYTKVYSYEFSDQNAPINFAPTKDVPSYGAYHTAEIPYIFQTAWQLADPAKFSADQQDLANRMVDSWVAFARKGAPSLAGKRSWRPVNKNRGFIRQFNVTGPNAVPDFAGEHNCAFWQGL